MEASTGEKTQLGRELTQRQLTIEDLQRQVQGSNISPADASGFAGMGLGATPVAIANMDAVTTRYGPSTKAFLVVPLVGAFFIDILNAGTINFFIRLIKDWLL